jgi:2-keto-4-pentenoate hydratase/2-oxohepta-3-ene-1,7-dioic acid hydratase in catechol pathway
MPSAGLHANRAVLALAPELAVVIGRRARKIETGRALEYVAGAMAFNDVSVRDLQMAGPL